MFKKERKYISLDNQDLEADCWLGIHEEQMILIILQYNIVSIRA